MNVKFHIDFKTEWGQNIYLLLYSSDASIPARQIALQCNQENKWFIHVQFDHETERIHYKYALLEKNGKNLIVESGQKRTLQALPAHAIVDVFDQWQHADGHSPFGSTAFTHCFLARTPKCPISSQGNLTIRLNATGIPATKHLAIIGNQDILGLWDPKLKVGMDESEFPTWSIQLQIQHISFPLEYKFVLVDTQTGEITDWEGGENHLIPTIQPDASHCIVQHNYFNNFYPNWKGAGVAIPVFSLRSEQSTGVGEFYDLKLLVDWARHTQQRVIQTLPINDTTQQCNNSDSYPYSAVSVFALHPLYLRPSAMGILNDSELLSSLNQRAHALNAKNTLEYQQVLELKWEYFQAIYAQEAAHTFASESYTLFFEQNKEWLVPYAAFSYLRKLHGTANFHQWSTHSNYNPEDIQQLCSDEHVTYPQIAIYYYLQYHLDKQLKEVHEYARINGVAIKGDIPIGVSPHSVDVWTDPQLFNTNMQAGAPPDDFSVTGQNWGFPTYNWSEMAKDGYSWWQKRFRKMAEYFDAYRIDHILGFFRIWAIPTDAVWGLTGSFQPAIGYTQRDLILLDIEWDEAKYTRPYITQERIFELFGSLSEAVSNEYLNAKHDGLFEFKTEYNTQRKIEKQLSTSADKWGIHNLQVRDGLYMLHCEVLFVRDVHHEGVFHPRIALQQTALYNKLQRELQEKLDRFHHNYFYQRHTEFWKQQALEKLPVLISATNMLVCGEDLGMIPDSVPDVMHALEILSLEIQRMPKKPWTEFGLPSEAPYLSVCTTSTHDMNPIRAWWLENKKATQRFYNHLLQKDGTAPDTCTSEVANAILTQHLQSNAMLVVLPWQDWLALDESLCTINPLADRINIPSDPHHYWCYRMHIPLEKMMELDSLNNEIRQMIKQSGR